MQVKKSEVKNLILKSAKEEFLEKGFEKASIRSIVKNANTTIGNFYNYFEGKEDVFNEIVLSSYIKVMRFIEGHNLEDEDPNEFSLLSPSQARAAVTQAIGLFSDSFIEDLIILAECSKGTKYEGFSHTLAEYLVSHFIEHQEILNPEYNDEGISRLLSMQFLSGVLSVLKQDISSEEKINLISEYLLFYAYGLLGILKK